jgi:uncharacterized protein YkvS
MNRVQTAVTAIHNCSNDELNQIIAAVKLRRTYLARTTARSLCVGDQVEFKGRGGHTERGRVVKINPKTVIVDAGPGQRWRVTASLLTPSRAV